MCGQRLHREQSDHGGYHHQHADDKDFLHREVGKQKGSAETTDSSEQEVNAGGQSGSGKCHVQTFHQQLRGRQVQAYINTYVADNT